MYTHRVLPPWYETKWQKGIDKELASHRKNRTWTLVPRSDATNVLSSRWVFNVKQLPDENGKLCEAAKDRLVARGFQQIEGIDYSETFAPVIKFTTIRLLLALVAHFDLELHQMDVITVVYRFAYYGYYGYSRI